VHELSIAHSIVGMLSEPTDQIGSQKIREVRLRIGALAGVSREALLFCYEIAAQDSPLADSTLVIRETPVIIFCSVCQVERELPGVQRFRCPECDTPSGDIRQGRELEVESVVVDEYASP
jgi:hydrogenase nickel incorporation protein HypA/HybF